MLLARCSDSAGPELVAQGIIAPRNKVVRLEDQWFGLHRLRAIVNAEVIEKRHEMIRKRHFQASHSWKTLDASVEATSHPST